MTKSRALLGQRPPTGSLFGFNRDVARLEVTRTRALWFGLALVAIGAVLVVTRQPPFQAHNNWSSTWADGASWMSRISLALGPLSAVFCAWQAGRGRDMHAELLSTTSRPPSIRRLHTWFALCVGVTIGYLGFAAIVAAALAPSVTYGGGRWVWAWVLVGLGWICCASVGFAAGCLLSGNLVAPFVGLVLYLGCGLAHYVNAPWVQLAPVAHLPSLSGYQLVAWVIPMAVLWLLALSTFSVALAVGVRRSWLVTAGVVAVGSAVILTLAPAGQVAPRLSWAEPDAAARHHVCTTDAGPRVCVFADHAGLLSEVTPLARGLLRKSDRFTLFSWAVESDASHPAPKGAIPLASLNLQFRMFRTGLAEPKYWLWDSAANITRPVCQGSEVEAYLSDDAALTARDVATALIVGDDSGELLPAGVTLYERLERDPAATRTWLADYLSAAHSCDLPTMARLGAP